MSASQSNRSTTPILPYHNAYSNINTNTNYVNQKKFFSVMLYFGYSIIMAIVIYNVCIHGNIQMLVFFSKSILWFSILGPHELSSHEKSFKTDLLKLGIWIIWIQMMVFACQSINFLNPTAAVFIPLVGIDVIAYLFYAYFIYDDRCNCIICKREGENNIYILYTEIV
ncbi:hypothetical protein O6P43_004523 [Quillaja saponaria]|uniref:Uncharacterized protein n=1 Tax=Quillaja saponaria TaxID=32244 RepID=A0AAD7VG56_QUISA|nr:hypothetical protein O6P43_004523 [Quillaja saponaria]